MGFVVEVEIGTVVESEGVRERHRREGRFVGLVVVDLIVVVLPSKGDLVLGGRELFGELRHRSISLQIGIGLGHCQKSTKCSAQCSFRCPELAHGREVLRIAGHVDASLGGGSPGVDDGFESRPLVMEIALHGLEKVRNEVVTPFELDVDLGEGVVHSLTHRHQLVVDPDSERGEHGGENEDDDECPHGGIPFRCGLVEHRRVLLDPTSPVSLSSP